MPGTEPSTSRRPLDIATGLVILAVVLLAVPPLVFLLPVAVVVLAVLYRNFARNEKRARALAERHLPSGGRTVLDVELSPGSTDAMVLNDWGIVCVRSRKRPVELAWSEITLVDEPEIAMLAFHSTRYPTFRVDLSQDWYFLATQAIHSKIADRTDFNVDPVTGETRLLRRLENVSFEWRGRWGHLAVSDGGVEFGRDRMGWHEIRRVAEVVYENDEVNPFHELRFTSDLLSFHVRSTWFDDGRQIGNTGYDLVKAVLAARIPDRVSFQRRPPTPRDRAAEEFNRCQEAHKVGFSFALRSGKLGYFEKVFAQMLMLVERFSLEGAVDARAFFHDYAEMLKRTGRPAEAARMESRACTTSHPRGPSRDPRGARSSSPISPI